MLESKKGQRSFKEDINVFITPTISKGFSGDGGGGGDRR
jgi:hypothetical protein